MDCFYVTLSSDSSKNYFTDNAISHFTTQLSRSICFSPSYEVAVCEVFLPSIETWKLASSLSPIFLYSDISSPVLVGDTSARLLRVLSPNILSGHYLFSSPYYVPVERCNISAITLSFNTKSGQRYPFPSGEFPSIVVLHFRKKSE